MPANLPPQYHTVEKKLREAKTPREKIAVIEELLTIIPKHKGTERLRGDYKRRLAKLRDEQQPGKGKGKSGGGLVRVEREGAGQAALVGPANTGKSALLKALTKAEPEVAPLPYTTRFPLPGMMAFEDVRVQLIDLAGAVHRDFIRKLAFARIWGRNTYPGQKVSKDYPLADKDVIELHV